MGILLQSYSKMREFTIREYSPKDHKDVLAIIIPGLTEMWYQAYKNTFNGSRLGTILIRLAFHALIWQLFSNIWCSLFVFAGYEVFVGKYLIQHLLFYGYIE